MSDWQSIEAFLISSGVFIGVDFVLLCLVIALMVKYANRHKITTISILALALLVFGKPIIALVFTIRLTGEGIVNAAFLTDLATAYQVLKHQHLIVLQVVILYTLIHQQILEVRDSKIKHRVFYLNYMSRISLRGVIQIVLVVAEVTIIISSVMLKRNPGSVIQFDTRGTYRYTTFFTFDSIQEEIDYFTGTLVGYSPVTRITSAIADGCLTFVSAVLMILSITNYFKFRSSILLVTVLNTIPMVVSPAVYLAGNFVDQLQILNTFLACFTDPIRYEIPLHFFMDFLMVMLVMANYWHYFRYQDSALFPSYF